MMSCLSWDFSFSDKTEHHVAGVGTIPTNIAVEVRSARVTVSKIHFMAS